MKLHGRVPKLLTLVVVEGTALVLEEVLVVAVVVVVVPGVLTLIGLDEVLLTVAVSSKV